MLGVHQSTLRTWADSGEIPVFRTPGGHRRFRLADLRSFLQSRASHTSGQAVMEQVMEYALAQVRQELAQTPQAWHSEIDAGTLESNRERGRRLFALALNFVMRPEQRAEILRDGQVLGREYGLEAAHHQVSLAETGRAVQFFRRQLLESVRRSGELDAGDLEIRRIIAQFLDEILYAVLEGYELAGSADRGTRDSQE